MHIAARSLLVALTAFSFGCGARSDPGTPGTSPSSSATTIPNPATSLGLARPLSPLSTSTTATRTPTLRWALPSTADGALVELCADRACSQS
ncbi:MAG TPA: hypothetical protein VF316_14545, partial [Polyangiaceae bacterium]